MGTKKVSGNLEDDISLIRGSPPSSLHAHSRCSLAHDAMATAVCNERARTAKFMSERSKSRGTGDADEAADTADDATAEDGSGSKTERVKAGAKTGPAAIKRMASTAFGLLQPYEQQRGGAAWVLSNLLQNAPLDHNMWDVLGKCHALDGRRHWNCARLYQQRTGEDCTLSKRGN